MFSTFLECSQMSSHVNGNRQKARFRFQSVFTQHNIEIVDIAVIVVIFIAS